MATTPKPYEGLSVIVKDANKLAAKRQQLVMLYQNDFREWALNRAFYMGQQWSFWNPVASEVQTLPTSDVGKAKHRVRLVDNQVRTGVNYWVAQLTKTRPVIGATPDSSSPRDAKAAQMAEALYDHLWEDLDLKSKLQTALVNAALSQGYWKITWDPMAGKQIKYMMGPDGQPILDDTMADIYADELGKAAKQAGQDEQALIEMFTKTVSVGELRIEALPGENVLLDPVPSNWTDCTFAICKHAMDPDEVQARFGVQVAPDSAPTDTDLPVFFTRDNLRKATVLTTKNVFVGYFRPTPALPKGRYVAWIESPNQILFESDWPYPFNELPLVKWPSYERPNSPLDDPVVTDVRPLQKELNRTISQIVQHKDMTLKPQVIAPTNSIRNRITDEPGAVIEFNPIGGAEPKWREMPGLPAYVIQHLELVQQRIDSKFNKLPSGRDSMPARVDAGYSIELLQEAVADQLSTVVNRIEVALSRSGKIMAALAQKYYTEPRLLKVTGPGGTVQVKKFLQADIGGGFTFYAESETGLPKSRAGRQTRIQELIQMGVIRPDQAWKHLDIADLKGLAARFAADEDQAQREIEKLIEGVPINPEALQQAMQAVNQGTDPNTGQPIESPEEAQQILEQASVAPTVGENYDVHLDILGDFMKSVEFDNLDPQARQRCIDHWSATLQTKMSLPQLPEKVEPVHTTLQLKGTVGPTAAAEILNRSGVIAATPEQLTEEPLETWVSDSVDKPDVESEGNDQLTADEQVQSMVHNEDQHQQSQAKTAHSMSLAQAHAEATQSAAEQTMTHAQQTHEQQMQHAKQQHAEKLRQMRKPKPKPGGGSGR